MGPSNHLYDEWTCCQCFSELDSSQLICSECGHRPCDWCQYKKWECGFGGSYASGKRIERELGEMDMGHVDGDKVDIRTSRFGCVGSGWDKERAEA